MRIAVAAILALMLAPTASADTLAAAELQSTRLVYASAQRIAARPVVAPGAAGELRVVGAPEGRPERRRVLRFSVAVEGGLRVDPVEFARTVEVVLGGPHGWSAAGILFRRVSTGDVDFRVVLASPALTDALCAPLRTNGRFSCASGSVAVLNEERWATGAEAYGNQLERYRTYMVNHEVGHVLGHGHAWCPEAGAPAPVMVQQTKGVEPCRPNPWPLPSELR